MGASAVSQRLMEHSAKVQAGSEPGVPRPVPGVIKSSASMTRAGTKILSRTAGQVRCWKDCRTYTFTFSRAVHRSSASMTHSGAKILSKTAGRVSCSI